LPRATPKLSTRPSAPLQPKLQPNERFVNGYGLSRESWDVPGFVDLFSYE
jgi:hypothetical protein